MKFSIIVACYNLGALVNKALDSCKNQVGIPLNEYEVLVINDGSKDDTLSYIQRYKDCTNFIIIDKKNGGLSQTRNQGISMAQGEYVLFLDGDDWYAEDMLLTLSQHLDGQDVLVFPMLYYYDDQNCNSILKGLQQGYYERDEFLGKTLGATQFSIIPAPKKAYRRKFLIDNNIRFVEGILHEDNPFFIDVMNSCDKVYYIDKPLYYYLQNRAGSITYQHRLKNFEGVMSGIRHIKELPISKNKSVRYLNGNMLVYQATQNYQIKAERKAAFSRLRSLSVKKDVLLYLVSNPGSIKTSFKLFMLLLDPLTLSFCQKLINFVLK